MQHTTAQQPKERESLFWRVLPTRFVMRFFRHIDNQESPTLTHTVGHVVGSLLLVGVPTAIAIFWKHISAALFFLFGSESLLRQPIEAEVWMLLLCIAVSFAWVILLKARVLPFVIRNAFWHTDAQHRIDVTKIVVELVVKGTLRQKATIELFGEPHQDVKKTLTVDYSVWGRLRKKHVKEGDDIVLD
jgi:hypothetical protein